MNGPPPKYGGNVDFPAVKDESLGSIERLVQCWLPDGRREGNEWSALNPTRIDARLGSFKVNLITGLWSDFATGDAGGDLLDLYVYLFGGDVLSAAKEIGDSLGVPRLSNGSHLRAAARNVATPRKTRALEVMAPEQSRRDPENFPPRTPPDQNGKPRFVVAGDEGPPRFSGEKRRHYYKSGTTPIKIKVMCKNGNALIWYRVSDNDKTGWQPRKPKAFQDLAFIGHLDPFDPERSGESVYWPEGEKDTDNVTIKGALALTFGGVGDGLPAGCQQFVRGRHVVILADNDVPGRKHAERKAALAAPVAESVKVIHFPELENKQDVSDWFDAGHFIDELRVRVAGVEIWRPETPSATAQHDDPTAEHLVNRAERRVSLPFGYAFSDRGLMWSNPNDRDKPQILIAGNFDVVAETRDGDGGSWGVLLHWQDHDGRDHRFALPRATLAGDGSEARRILMDGGLFIAPSQTARSLFNSFLLQVKSSNRARATQRVGWHGPSFVMPDDCFGEDEKDTLLLQSATAHDHAFRQAGTLRDWQQNVARYAIGNSRLVLAISAAFAGPLIGPCSAEGGGLHFKGPSSTGKSTALNAAGSVWGGGDTTYVRSWRATANGLEGVCLGHCDTLLCLDEMSQLAAKDAGEVAYMIANGAGKSRSSRDGSARSAAKWRVLFLSSGEVGLADKVAEDGRGRKLAAGQQVRIVDISADAGAGMGMFESLHGFPSAESLARHLRAATHQNYGIAARLYLSAVVPTIDDVRTQIAAMMRAFSERFVPEGADGQIERVAQRFAIVAVGGELAQQQGIVPWDAGEAIEAAGKCFCDWLRDRGGIDAAEARDGIEQVRSFLLANGMARFIPAWEEDQNSRVLPRDVAGFREKVSDGWDYFVTTSAWKEEVCRGLDSRRVAATLAQRGLLKAADATRRAKLVTVPGHGKLRLYHVVSRFLEDDRDA